jgi:DNA excision repair protein ERCC-4
LDKIAHRFLEWRAGIFKMQATNQAPKPTPTTMRGRPPPNKRRRVRGGSVVASTSGRTQTLAESFRNDVIETVAALDEDEEGGDDDDPEFHGVGPLTDDFDPNGDDLLASFEEIPNTSLMTIQRYEDDLNEQILEDTQPRFIIVFDPNPGFVRQIEVYRAAHPTVDIRVYFMMYENSVEEQNYLSLIRKEKVAFEKLIHEKSVKLSM